MMKAYLKVNVVNDVSVLESEMIEPVNDESVLESECCE